MSGQATALKNQVAIAIATLRDGGVVAIPTDTVYGYAASLDHPTAMARLYTMKGRPEAKAIPILLASMDTLARVAETVDRATMQFAARWWPGALTLIVDAAPHLPAETITLDATGARTIAVRVPANAIAASIIVGTDGALAVTSANRSGEAPFLSAMDIPRAGPASPDFVLDGGDSSLGLPSTIIRVTRSSLQVVREGAIGITDLAQFAADLGIPVETPSLGTV